MPSKDKDKYYPIPDWINQVKPCQQKPVDPYLLECIKLQNDAQDLKGGIALLIALLVLAGYLLLQEWANRLFL